MREQCKFSGEGNAAELFAKGMRAADMDESDWMLRDELKIIEENKVFVIMDDHGEERPDLAAVEADTLEEALPVLRMLMQQQDDVFNYVVIDNQIAQFEGHEGFLGDAEDITEEELNHPELWDIDYANIRDACELDGSGKTLSRTDLDPSLQYDEEIDLASDAQLFDWIEESGEWRIDCLAELCIRKNWTVGKFDRYGEYDYYGNSGDPAGVYEELKKEYGRV